MHTTLLALPAADEGPGGPSQGVAPSFDMWPLLIGLVVVMVVMSLFGNKKEKQRRARIQGLKKHDQVVTSGGIYGTIVNLDEGTVTLEVSKDVRIRFKRSSVYDHESAGEGAKGAAKGAAPEATKKASAKSS